MALDDGSCATVGLSELPDQVDHTLDDEAMGAMTEADELQGASSTGGVTHRRGGATYDLLRMSQNEANSGPSSITPLSLIPYLKTVNLYIAAKVCATHLVTTSQRLSVVRVCPCRATLQVPKPKL